MLPERTYAGLPTEQVNPKSRALDRLSTRSLLLLMNREDTGVPRAIHRVLPDVERAVELIVASLRGGGRWWMVGAGTSGRFAVLEAAECPPTFNTPPTLIQAIMAGGPSAVFRSKEGAEDDQAAAWRAVQRSVKAGDVVLGIAASGVTPFVEAALGAARSQGASTILLTGNSAAGTGRTVQVVIAPSVGPEIIAGSTRLKSGTATKLILNMLTVATMTRLGKVHGNLMVDVRPTSTKLRARALRLIQTITGVAEAEATRCLQTSGNHTKIAIVMAARHLDARAARTLLATHHDILRNALTS